MSSISGISTSSSLYASLYDSDSADSMTAALKKLNSALQSGDASNAQTALAALQKLISANATSATAPAASSTSSTTSSQPFGDNTQANSDYQNVVGAIQSGNLSGAQSAMAKLQEDLKTITGGHHHHHGGPPPTPTTTDTTASTDTDSSVSTSDDTTTAGVNVNVVV